MITSLVAMRWPIATGSSMEIVAFQIHDEFMSASLSKGLLIGLSSNKKVGPSIMAARCGLPSQPEPIRVTLETSDHARPAANLSLIGLLAGSAALGLGLSELAAGHPVQVWIQTWFARVTLATWTAWDGTQVRYSFAEHSVTLSGVSPTEVRVNDVLNASQYWVSKALFEENFADFNNMAVIFQ